MATANFKTQKDFDLYATTIFQYEITDENNNPTGEYDFDYYYFNDCKDFIDSLNKQLCCFEITLIDGYYEGIQTYIKETDYWTDDESLYDSEIALINNVLLPQLKEYAFDKYIISAQFSNGETFYKKVD